MAVPILVEVPVQLIGDLEEDVDVVVVVGFGADAIDDSIEIVMTVVRPASMFADRLQDLRCGAPALFGCLPNVTSGEFDVCLGKQEQAGFAVGLCGHSEFPPLPTG